MKQQLRKARVALNGIDINTQDPDEIERGSQLAADISEIEAQLAAEMGL